MAEIIYPFALTTLARVKARLTITTTGHDAVLTRLVNAVTDYIQKECNRSFLSAAYTDEVYSVYGVGQNHLLLKQSPVSSVAKLQYRVGLKTDPQWTDFMADDWELLEDGQSGIIRVYGSLIRGTNVIRITYTAGYLIDFANAGDSTKHTLPADLTDLCERLVTRWFKRREAEGKETETFDNLTVKWKDDLNKEDKQTLAAYKRLPVFV